MSDLVPLYGFVEGDSLGIVVVVPPTHTIAELADKLRRAVAMRVAIEQGAELHANGQRLDPSWSVAQSGLSALDRVDLVTPDGRSDA